MKKILLFVATLFAVTVMNLNAETHNSVPAGTGNFSVTISSTSALYPMPEENNCDSVFIVGNFASAPWIQTWIPRDLDPDYESGGNPWTIDELDYPADFEFQFVIQYEIYDGGNITSTRIVVPDTVIKFDGKTFDYQITLSPKEKVTLAAEYGTYISANTCTLPAGLKAYTCDAIDAGGVLQLSEATSIIANTPYILKGTAGTTYNCEVTATGTYTQPVTQGLLTGVFSATSAPVGSYVLQNLNDVLGFYQVAAGAEPTVGENRCYLTLPAPEVKALYFDQETAIENLTPSTTGEGSIYNLSGQKLQKLQKGINIVNGKKVLF